MFAVEFMTGAVIFGLINLAIFVITLYTFFRIGRKLVDYVNDESEDKTVTIKKELFVLGVIVLGAIFFGSLSQPKVAIDLPLNRDLIEYQENKEEIIIKTPEPRTKVLEGFTPLKKD